MIVVDGLKVWLFCCMIIVIFLLWYFFNCVFDNDNIGLLLKVILFVMCNCFGFKFIIDLYVIDLLLLFFLIMFKVLFLVNVKFILFMSGWFV